MTDELVATADAPQLAEIERVVDAQIRPLLRIHGGGIDVVSVSTDGHVELEFQGACRACALKIVTYAIAVRERLLRLPGVRGVVVRGVNLSDAALDRAGRSYAGYSLMFRAPHAGTSRGDQPAAGVGGAGACPPKR